MAGARANLFDRFLDDNEGPPVYTELQPICLFPMDDGPEPPVASNTEQESEPIADDLNVGDHSTSIACYSGIELDNSYSQQPHWVPDEDCGSEDEGSRLIQSDDESSTGEELSLLLEDSDPEPEQESEDELANDLDNPIQLPSSSNVVMGKNGMIRSKVPFTQVGRTPNRNVFKPPKSRVKNSKNVFSVSSAFFLIFTKQVLEFIVQMTNLEGARVKGSLWKAIDLTEMKALFGLLIHLGARKLNLTKLKKIWYGASADNVAKCTMSIRRFAELTSVLRFDDKATRSLRRARDLFAPLRKLFDDINKNLQREYIPSSSLTVDEQLVPWRGRARFLQYLPSKPDKYGLKLFLICDSETAYPLQAIPYLGKHGDRKKNLGRETVIELAAPYAKTGRNITCDNFFTDLELAEWLSKNGLSLVGTVRKNKAFLPVTFQKGTGISKFDSSFIFKDGVGLVAYKSNEKKHVVVVSTMHHSSVRVEPGRKRKPESISYYNKTKGGVDVFDYMCHSFTTKRKTRSWPMVLFYNLLDTPSIAAHIIYRECFPNDTSVHGDRGKFNEQLAKELVLEHLERRMNDAATNLTNRTKLSYEILKKEWKFVEAQTGTVFQTGKRKARRDRCVRCPRKKDRKVSHVCDKCHGFVCKDHLRVQKVCTVCG